MPPDHQRDMTSKRMAATTEQLKELLFIPIRLSF